MDKDSLQNKIIHSLFEVTVFTKGIHGILEIIIGIMFFFIKKETIYKILIGTTHQKVVRSSGHFVTNYLTRQANNFSISTQYFIAIYFLFYGVINIFLVISLLRGKLWAYPVAIIFFSLFIIYIIYRSFLHHSGSLLFFSILDIILVILTWLEYKRVKHEIQNTKS